MHEHGNLDIFLHPRYRNAFQVVKLIRKPQEWNLVIYEKSILVPQELKGKPSILNGFMNPIEILDFPFHGKPMYLQFYRRRWMDAATRKNFTNTYEVHPDGMKATREFGLFLKEVPRRERDQLLSVWTNAEHTRKEDLQMVP